MVEKETSLSEIPGLTYQFEDLANIPKPVSWENSKLSAAAHQAIKMKTLAIEVHDPRHPDFQSSSIDDTNSFLEPFYKFCETNPIASVRDLEGAPREVKNLLRAHHLRPKMMKHLFTMSARKPSPNSEAAVVYADDEELAAMEVCHPCCIEILTEFFEVIPERSAHRAIDVAGGDGRLSASFLQKHYLKVDLFDGCKLAV